MSNKLYSLAVKLLFILLFLYSCKKDTDPIAVAPPLSEVQQKLDDPRPVEGNTRFVFTDPNSAIGLIQRVPKYKVDVVALGTKDSKGYLKDVTQTLIYNPNTLGWITATYDKGYITQIETSKGYIIDFKNYNKTTTTVEVNVTRKADNKLLVTGKSIALSSDYFQNVDAYKQAAGGRMSATAGICDEDTKRLATALNLSANLFSCTLGFLLIGVSVAETVGTGGLGAGAAFLLIPEGLGLILSCGSLVSGLNELINNPTTTEKRINKDGGCDFSTAQGIGYSSFNDCFKDFLIGGVKGFAGGLEAVIKCAASLLASGTQLYGCGCKDEPKKEPNGRSTGDPHLTTSDNLLYDFQGHGEFIAAKSTIDNFEVQVRQEDVNNSGTATLNTAIAIQTGNDVVCVTAKPDQLYINNKPQDLSFNTLPLSNSASISRGVDQGLTVIDITTQNGDIVRVRFHNSYLLDYLLYLKDNRKGTMIGLMGNYDGNPSNDLQIQNGNLVKNTFDGLYPTYANSWRVKANSLFYYASGKNTDSYTKLDFPKSKAVLSLEAMQKAEVICRNAGVSSEPFLSNCIYDVVVSGDNALASSARWGQQYDLAATRATLPPSSIITKFLDAKELSATYEVVNSNLYINFTTTQDLVPSVLVDVNQNGRLDANLDRSYGSYGTQYPTAICVQYLIDLITTSYCGTPNTKATQTTDGKTFKFIIPITELNTTSGKTTASIVVKAYSPTTYYHYYPSYSNNVATYFSNVYTINLN